MKKVLVVCNYFAPDNAIAAVRLTKIAKKMRESGYDVTVIAEQKEMTVIDELLEQDAKGIRVIRVKNTARVQKIIAFYQKIIWPIKEPRFNRLDNRMQINKKTGKTEFCPYEIAYPILGSLDYFFEILRQYDLFWQAKKYLCTAHDYSCFFTSYGDYFGYFCGKYLKKQYPKIPWIFDIRDSICRYKLTPKYGIPFAKRAEQYVADKADCIIGVSKGICQQFPKKYWNKIRYISNGFDRNDRQEVENKNKIDKRLMFVYTGSMYGGLRDMSPLFGILRQLIGNRVINKEEIQVCFAGKESAFQIFRSQAKSSCLDDVCTYRGSLTRKEALALQMEADLLLVSTWDYQSRTGGVITGKALEYISANKPIIAIISGDIEKSELADIIRSGNLGAAYLEAHGEEDGAELYQYLKTKIEEFKNDGKIYHHPCKEVIEKYDYENIGKRVVKLMKTLI